MSKPESGSARPSDSALERLHALHPKKIDLSLERLERVLARLDHPERHLPPVIHVAGTNGKGSTVAFCRAIAEAAGLRVHVYTSPHLVRFNERIRLSGALIDDDTLMALIERVETANAGAPLTFFEATTAVAFLGFAEAPADLCLVEVGMGGRFDATNVIAEPVVCAITPVSLDHAEFLGSDVAGIAAEKAGILKPGVTGVIGPQVDAAEATIRRIARERRAPLAVYGRDWLVTRRGAGEDGQLIFRDAAEQLELPLPGLPGVHQINNAGIAVAAMRTQEAVEIPPAAYKAGLGWGRWPARLQRLESGHLADKLAGRGELWLDGGHNPAAGLALKAHFKDIDPESCRFYLICGMLHTKEADAFLKPFAGLAELCQTVPVPRSDKPYSPGDLAAEASKVGLRAQPAASVASALDRVLADCPANLRPVILIAGSLYLAGAVLEESGLIPD